MVGGFLSNFLSYLFFVTFFFSFFILSKKWAIFALLAALAIEVASHPQIIDVLFHYSFGFQETDDSFFRCRAPRPAVEVVVGQHPFMAARHGVFCQQCMMFAE